MKKVKDKLNVCTKWLLYVIVLINLTACNNKKKIELKNKEGVVIESYFVEKDHPEIKTGVYYKYYDDGKILEVSLFKDGRQDGERTLYYPNGKIMQQEHYVANRFEGKFASYYEDGSLQQEGTYKDNMMSGIWKNYFKEYKNVLKEEMTFKDNKIEGPYKEYYSNGKVFMEGYKTEIYDEVDVFAGKVNVYDSLGVLEKVITFENGRQINKEEKK